MWNDTDIPLAYFISFRAYGTWLHGDERGSIDRFHNKYKSPYFPTKPVWEQSNRAKLKSDPVKLDAARRRACIEAISETCAIRKWTLLAKNIRTNHVHTVVDVGLKEGELALNAFKANATRRMREDDCWEFEHSPWARKGSCRRLWNERSVARAIDYVINGQGNDLPDFD